MIGSLPPALILIVGGLMAPLVPGRMRKVLLILLPVFSFLQLLGLHPGDHAVVSAFGLKLTLLRVDRLSLVFAYIFHLAAFLSVIYALHVKEALEDSSALVYVGAAVGALFAGDLVTLFVYWELSAVASVFLIWSRRTPRATSAGLRYLTVQVISGLLLLAGLVLRYQATKSIAFERMTLGEPGTWLIFLAFGIKCAFPLLHNWLQDAYPEATVSGTVFLSAFTTKLAVYALARGFPGTGILIGIGVAMTLFPIFYAVIENDLRRVLAYSLNNQLGFMVVGIGVGTPLALNGTVSHAFAHILYKALLFMSMGAILFRAGTVKGSELGGLYKSMPWTTAFCIVGAASISAFPLFSGFVTKGMTLSATADGGHAAASLLLLFASAGVLHHSGIRIPFHGFFGHDSGIRCKEAPPHMLVAMGVTAFLCIAIGVYPRPLYAILPHSDVTYRPYTAHHVILQGQLLLFAVLAFVILKRRNLEPADVKGVNLDTDWSYRRLPRAVWAAVGVPVQRFALGCRESAVQGLRRVLVGETGEGGILGYKLPKVSPISQLVAVSVLMLFVYLVVVFMRSAGR